MLKWLTVFVLIPACTRDDITSVSDLPGTSTTSMDLYSFGIAVHVYGNGLPVLRYIDGSISTVAAIEHRFAFSNEMPDFVELPVTVGNRPLVINGRGCTVSTASACLYEHVVLTDFDLSNGTDLDATISYDCFDADGTTRSIPPAPITFGQPGDISADRL